MQDIIIGVSGYKLGGKTTICDYLRERYSYEVLALAEPFYRGLGTIFGEDFLSEEWQRDKDRVVPLAGVSLRTLLQTIGTEWGRNVCGLDVWVRVLASRVDVIRKLAANRKMPAPKFAISDVREMHEINWVLPRGVLIWVENPRTYKPDSHSSETGVAKKYAQYKIMNDGTKEQLYQKIEEVMLDIAHHRR